MRHMNPEAYERVLLDDKAIVMTGAASGIGKETALLAARRGALVVVADIDDAGGETTVKEIREAGGTAVYQHADVAVEDDAAALVDRCVAEFGRLDAAFNNAAVRGARALLAEIPHGRWDRTISVNLGGVFNCMQYEIAYMLDHGGGSIVNTSSVAGIVAPRKTQADYTASKHAVLGLTRAAALEYGPMAIRINALIPGVTRTPMLAESLEHDPKLHDELMVGQAMGRWAEMHELAEGAAWLFSDASSFMSGAAFVVDGGYTAT